MQPVKRSRGGGGRCMNFSTKELPDHATNHWVIGKTAPSEKRNVCLPSGTGEANEPEMMYYFLLLHEELNNFQNSS